MIATIFRTIIMYFFVTIGIRLMGKRQIGDMQPNELVVTLLISEIAAIPLQDTNQPVLNGVIAIFVLVVLEIILSVLAMKNFFVRKIMSGQSVVVIKNGMIDQSAMKMVRMTVLDLIELLRGQNVFDISTVAFAVLEVNGDLSVLLKTEEMPVTLKDIDIQKDSTGLPLPVITDGKIVSESLKALKTDEDHIAELIKRNNTELKDVFLMMLDRFDNINLVKKNNKG